jgi:HD-like signal output (HDOD) protein
MNSVLIPDKSGAALNELRFQMLQDIAKELARARDVVFPTSFEIVARLRKAAQDPDLSLDQIATFVAVEPLISARLTSMANSSKFAGDGKPIKNVRAAAQRLGLKVVRATVTASAMNQLLRSKDTAKFSGLAAQLWQHSLHTAAAAELIAGRMTRIAPEEAMLAGLVHDLGAFYMLYRANQYEELRQRPDTIRYLILQWHESIGHAVLIALGMPEDIAEAVREHDTPRRITDKPRDLGEVIYIANKLAGGMSESVGVAPEADAAAQPTLADGYLQLADEIAARKRELEAVFG